jgi:hypothetical protein
MISRDRNPTITPAKVGCAGCLLNLVGSTGLTLGAMALGFTIMPINTIVLITLLGGVSFYFIAASRQRRRPRLPMDLLVASFLLLNFGLVAFFIWDTPRFCARMILGSPLPSGIIIRNTQIDETPDGAAYWGRFTANPETVSAILRKKQLILDEQYLLNRSSTPAWFIRVQEGDFRHYTFSAPPSGGPATHLWVNSESNEVHGVLW